MSRRKIDNDDFVQRLSPVRVKQKSVITQLSDSIVNAKRVIFDNHMAQGHMKEEGALELLFRKYAFPPLADPMGSSEVYLERSSQKLEFSPFSQWELADGINFPEDQPKNFVWKIINIG